MIDGRRSTQLRAIWRNLPNYATTMTTTTTSISTRMEFDYEPRIADRAADDGGGRPRTDDSQQRRRRRPVRRLTTGLRAQQLRGDYCDCSCCSLCPIFALTRLMLRTVCKPCETEGRLPILMNKYVYFFWRTKTDEQIVVFETIFEHYD